jgi:hypothetical protein
VDDSPTVLRHDLEDGQWLRFKRRKRLSGHDCRDSFNGRRSRPCSEFKSRRRRRTQSNQRFRDQCIRLPGARDHPCEYKQQCDRCGLPVLRNVFATQNPSDAHHQAAAGCRDSKHRLGCTHAFEFDERLRVQEPIAAHLNRNIVAAMLAFGANPSGQPPNSRMIEKNGFDAALERIYDEIAAQDVSDLMSQYSPQLCFIESCNRTHRK